MKNAANVEIATDVENSGVSGQMRGSTRQGGPAQKSMGLHRMRMLISALAIAAMSAVWFNVAPASAQEPQQFGDWILRCESRGIDKADICYLHQTINYSKDDVSGMLLDVKIGALGEGRELFALLMLPLGVNFQSGVVLQADAGDPTPVTIQTCTNEGCRSVAPVSTDLLWGFRQGKVLKVGFIPFGGTQVVVVEASLTGFTAAYRMLELKTQ
ncbi:MAG: invasion associated locus B family protein [Proteobacteria bacterium]|nr:invasion associated locus B family protein [Pseudomonadota bacterium]MDA1355618.1 invasion associated locus B family protein [Pseudomonadota bacterium]